MSRLETVQTTTIEESETTAFVLAALAARRLLADQALLTQSRCVDTLLDLFNLTTEPAVRAVLTGCLGDIRHTWAVSGEAMHRCLDLVLAATDVELAYADLVLS
jgi:hypothetical protein